MALLHVSRGGETDECMAKAEQHPIAAISSAGGQAAIEIVLT